MTTPPESPRLLGRNGDIWQRWIRGWTQDAIAKHYGLTAQRVSQIIHQVQDSIPQATREALIVREIEFLETMRREAVALVDAGPIPAYSNGRPVLGFDGETVAEDHSGRLTAMNAALKINERVTKMLGLDAPTRVEATVNEAAAAAAVLAAEEAAAALSGE